MQATLNRFCWWTAVAVLILSLSTARADLTRGLVAHYPFDGNADDVSGNNNHGVINGGVAPTTDRNGSPNSAYAFNGVNGYIVARADNLPTATRTVSLWFKANTLDNRPTLLGYGGNACGTTWFQGLNAGPAQYNDGYYVSSHCDINNLIEEYNPSDVVGRWIHLVILTSSRGTVMYVNGVSVASNENFVQNTYVAGRDLAIGVIVSPFGYAPYIDGNVGYLNGSIDDVRIYNRRLSRREIRQLYSGTL
jgi:hypothetical protein